MPHTLPFGLLTPPMASPPTVPGLPSMKPRVWATNAPQPQNGTDPLKKHNRRLVEPVPARCPCLPISPKASLSQQPQTKSTKALKAQAKQLTDLGLISSHPT